MPQRDIDERAHLNLEDIKDYAVFRVDPEGYIASWNAGAEHMKLYTEQEVIGQPFAMLFTPEDVQSNKPRREMEIAAETGIYEGEEVRVRKGGELFDAHVILRPLSDQHGVHRGFIKVTRDITERKRTMARKTRPCGCACAAKPTTWCSRFTTRATPSLPRSSPASSARCNGGPRRTAPRSPGASDSASSS